MANLTKREKQRIKKVAKKHWKPLLVIVCLLIIVCVVAYYLGWVDVILDKFNTPSNPPTEQGDGNNSSGNGNSSNSNSNNNSQTGETLNTAGGYSTTVDNMDDLVINFIDVGQGDCIIIQLPDGKNMIIDSGDDETARKNIENFIEAEEITTFDYVLLTHQDKDHSANMDWVIDTYNCKYIFRPNNNSTNSKADILPSDFNTGFEDKDRAPTATYANFLISAYNEMSQNGAIVEIFNKDSDFSNDIVYNGETYSYSFNFLTPTASRNEIQYDDYNDYSPIVMLEWQGKRILFTGDAEKDNIEEFLLTYDDTYNIDVLKVGHHGSDTSTTPEFVSAIDPEYAVIQCGTGNSYGHPCKEPLDIFKNYQGGVEVYRNDTNGDIVLTIDFSGQIEFDLENDDTTNNFVAGVKPSKNVNFNVYDIYTINILEEKEKFKIA